jgi:hypothetical protein
MDSVFSRVCIPGRPGNGRFRVIPVILWKQYSGRKVFGFFQMISGRFLPESRGSWQESTGKNLDNFWPEYCFHVPAISGVFLQETMTFLQDPVAKIFDRG